LAEAGVLHRRRRALLRIERASPVGMEADLMASDVDTRNIDDVRREADRIYRLIYPDERTCTWSI
jgi:hypothetical protein